MLEHGIIERGVRDRKYRLREKAGELDLLFMNAADTFERALKEWEERRLNITMFEEIRYCVDRICEGINEKWEEE